jgi:hypothetical protein
MLVMIAGAMAGVACSVVFPYDGYGPGTEAPDAADGAPPFDAADAFTPGCPLTRYPARPAADDPGGQETDLNLAISTLVLGVGTAATPGLDLDGLCTCPDDPPCISSQRVCDREGGVDNAFDDLLGKFGSFGAPVKQEKVQAALDSGETTFLVVIRRYNGLANDTSVELGLIASLGTTRDDGGSSTPPLRDGTDEWTVDPSSVSNVKPPFVPNSIATEAYVTNGVVVARGNFIVALGSGTPVTITLDEGVITGRLEHDGIWRMKDARLAGRFPTSKLLTSLATIIDPTNKNGFLCGDSGVYQTYKPQVCSAADISATGASDLSGKKCDALSIGAGFEAVEARIGALAPARIQDAGCGPDWKDDCAR